MQPYRRFVPTNELYTYTWEEMSESDEWEDIDLNEEVLVMEPTSDYECDHGCIHGMCTECHVEFMEERADRFAHSVCDMTCKDCDLRRRQNKIPKITFTDDDGHDDTCQCNVCKFAYNVWDKLIDLELQSTWNASMASMP